MGRFCQGLGSVERESARAAERRERERPREDGRQGQLDEQAMQVPRGQSGVTRGQSCGPRRRIRETPDAMSALESTPRLAGLSGGLMEPCHGGNSSRILLLLYSSSLHGGNLFFSSPNFVQIFCTFLCSGMLWSRTCIHSYKDIYS